MKRINDAMKLCYEFEFEFENHYFNEFFYENHKTLVENEVDQTEVSANYRWLRFET